jgi:hypothetical protein
MSANERNILEEYKIKVGSRSYVFSDVPLQVSPTGKWVLSYDKVQEMMKSVAAIILADKDQALTFAELEHLANTAGMSMAKIAELIQVDRSTITKWKRSEELIPFSDSYCLKDKFPKIIFEFEPRKDDMGERVDFWFTKGKLPRPKAA